MSTSTGVAPASRTTLAVAGNVYAGTMTSSPSPIPSASTARWSAAVPFETATACSTPHACRDELLELLHLRAHRQRTRLEDLANGLQLGLAELRER